ncbi:hypothetical protein FRX31_005901 [Thalictrum thalictroides]|uniref:Uncharacterized protein n=1 Tax=Thalictrum thalictroides TaxID=46969 RepID=A0A7J6X455_THATH|nr:hypothetical protein FRX31_005901 [Thalictrum thalictroides]
MASSNMNPSIDLNFPPARDEGELIFDQHHVSLSTDGNTNNDLDHFVDKFGSNISQEETNLDMEDPVPMIITSSSTGTIVIDLNMDPHQECETPLLELDIDQLLEEDEHIADLSEEDDHIAAPSTLFFFP